MIKIMHLITDLNAGGAELMLLRLIPRMDHGHFRNIVVSLKDRGKLGEAFGSEGIEVHALGMRGGIPSMGGIWRLIKLVKSKQPQIIQTWLYHADLLGLIAGKITRTPAVIWNLRCSELSIHDHPRSLLLMRILLAKFSRCPRAVIVNSVSGKIAHERLGYRPDHWKVIANGFDTELFRPSEEFRSSLRKEIRVREETPLVGMVARFNVMKDHGNFLEAAGILRRSMPSVQFVLVGQGISGENQTLRNEICSRGLGDCAHLFGERPDMPRIYAALDVAVSASYSEGFPNVIGEAMACEIPCVGTDAGDTSHLISDAGFVVPVRDPAALSAAMRNILEMNTEARRQLGRKARQRILECFSMNAAVEKYQELYRQVLASLRSPN